MDNEKIHRKNFVVSYAHGELCPVSFTGGVAENEEHNQALIACVI